MSVAKGVARRVWDFQGTLPVWVQPHLWWLFKNCHHHIINMSIADQHLRYKMFHKKSHHCPKMLCNISLVSSGSDVCSSTCTDWHIKVERFGKICKSQRLQKCFVAPLLICNPMAAENTSGQIKVERRLPKVFSLPTLLCAKYFILTNSTSIDKQMKMVKLGNYKEWLWGVV